SAGRAAPHACRRSRHDGQAGASVRRLQGGTRRTRCPVAGAALRPVRGGHAAPSRRGSGMTSFSAWRTRVIEGCDAWHFRAGRADYYAYLADMLQSLQGRKTLLDHFEDDARRYGPATVRGRLSQRWARRYQESGGDLAAAWSGTLPADECLLVASAQ